MGSRKILITAAAIATGGLGSYLFTVARGLTLRGWDVHVLITDDCGDRYNDMEQYAVCHNMAGLSLSWKKVFTAAELIKGLAADVVLLNHTPLVNYALPLLDNKIKPVAVLHSDDTRFYRSATLFRDRIFRWIAPSISVEQGCRNYLANKVQGRFKTISHGVDSAIFFPGTNRGRGRRRKISFIGYIDRNKGADLLPSILSMVVSKYPEAQLEIIGYGPMREHLERKFAKYGLSDAVVFTGVLRPQEVGDRLRETDVLLLPTRIEGFGLVIAEAMMCGAVPVVSLLKGITDNIVDDGVNGFVVQPENVHAFAETIIALLGSPERIESLSFASQTAARERFSEKRMLDSYEALFAEDDDRRSVHPRGKVGWIKETVDEIMHHGIDAKWLVRRVAEVWK